MYIGSLTKGQTPEFTYAHSNITLSPDKAEGGVFAWRWDRIYDSTLEVTLNLGRRSYVGAVVAKIEGGEGIEIYVGGTRVSFTGEVSPVGLYGDTVSLCITGKLEELTLSELDVLGSYDDGAPLLFPTPKTATLGSGEVKIGEILKGTGRDESFAAEFFRESLTERFGDITDKRGTPVSFTLSESREYSDERITVSIKKDKIEVTAATRLGLLMGATRLVALVRDGMLPVMEIDDRPALPMRGFHMGLPRRDRFDFVKRLFRYVLLPLGYNHVIVEFNGAMRFDSHPAIAEGWVRANERAKAGLQPPIAHGDMGADGTALEKAEVRELLGYIAELGFEIIPEIQSLGHVQYITNVYPEIAEREVNSRIITDRRGEDERPDEFYPHTYCPSNPRSLEIIRDLIEEIIEVAKPKRYIHIGHDEIYQLSLCPLCAKKSRKDNYLGHILALREQAKAHGLNVMIWSDMLHNNMEYSTETYSARDELPRDVVLLDFTWYFHPAHDIEAELLPLGFNVMIGNLYSSHFPRYSSRMKKEGMIGGEVSTWTAVSEEVFAANGKLFDLAYTSEMLWRLENYDERNRRAYTKLITDKIQPEHRDALHGRLGKVASCISIPLPEGDRSGIPESLVRLCPDVIRAEGVTVSVGTKCDRILIEGATLNSMPRLAWKPLSVIGSYTVSYKDGTKEQIPLEYAGNIMKYDTLYAEPKSEMYYRHQGYLGTWYSDPTYEGRDESGAPVTLSTLCWYNPHPEKEIESLTYRGEAVPTVAMVSKIAVAK